MHPIIRYVKQRIPRLNGKKIAVLGILSGLSLVAFLLESLIPLPFLPGAKLGLANLFSLIALTVYGLPEALAVVAVRTVLGSLFAGNVSMLIYSLTAGIVSCAAARLLLFGLPRISLVCVSTASAVIHNVIQLLVYCAMTQTMLLFVYSPYLLAAGALSGALVGITATILLKKLPVRLFEEREKLVRTEEPE